MLYVCPLSQLARVVSITGARHIVTLINADTPVARPLSVAPENHLFLGFNDIVSDEPGMTPPGADHVEQLLGFVGRWPREKPLVIHCFAGISRSTAAAFITACALSPERDEAEIAQTLRRTAPSATPNARLVALADRQLGREGRMSAAIAAIGRGRDAFEGNPFRLDL